MKVRCASLCVSVCILFVTARRLNKIEENYFFCEL